MKRKRHKTVIGPAPTKKKYSDAFADFWANDAMLMKVGRAGEKKATTEALVLRAEPGSTVKIRFNSKGGASLSFIRNVTIPGWSKKKSKVKHVD